MTMEEAQKIMSAFYNGYEYPFGNGIHDNCDMAEVERHARLLRDALKHAIETTED